MTTFRGPTKNDEPRGFRTDEELDSIESDARRQQGFRRHLDRRSALLVLGFLLFALMMASAWFIINFLYP